VTQPFGPELRASVVANLGRHDRLAFELDGRRHAAVAVVVVDSDADVHGDDPHPFSADRMAEIPGGEPCSGCSTTTPPGRGT
jgi:hypothetical protein